MTKITCASSSRRWASAGGAKGKRATTACPPPSRREQKDFDLEHAQRQDRAGLRDPGQQRLLGRAGVGGAARHAPGAFYLLTGKVAQHTQFATHNNKLLHERVPTNPLWINTQPGADAGHQADGDEIWVESAGRQGENDRPCDREDPARLRVI